MIFSLFSCPFALHKMRNSIESWGEWNWVLLKLFTLGLSISLLFIKAKPLEFMTNCLFRSPMLRAVENSRSSSGILNWMISQEIIIDEIENLNCNFPSWLWTNNRSRACRVWENCFYHLFMVLWAMDYNTIFYSLIFLSISGKGLILPVGYYARVQRHRLEGDRWVWRTNQPTPLCLIFIIIFRSCVLGWWCFNVICFFCAALFIF